jgi:hypothetical protein
VRSLGSIVVLILTGWWTAGCSGGRSAAAGGAAPSGEPDYYVVGSLERVSAGDPLPAQRSRAIGLSAAANEAEGFQVVVYGGSAGLRGVQAAAPEALAASHGGQIGQEHVVLYREHYVRVTAPSGGSARAKAGVYPDGLIPLRNPFTGEAMPAAAPFDVPAGENRVLYVEVRPPAGTPAADYAGRVRLTAAGQERLGEVRFHLRVRGFELPAGSTLRTSIQAYDSEHAGAARYYGYPQQGDQHQAAARAIDELLIAHRLVPTHPMNTLFEVSPEGTIAPHPARDATRWSYLRRPEYTDYQIAYWDGFPFPGAATTNRARTLRYLRSAYQWFEERGVAEKVWVRPGDEPQSAADHQAAAQLARLAREADPRLRVAITLDHSRADLGAPLFGQANLVIPYVGKFDPALWRWRQQAGDEIWSYTALTPRDDRATPTWQIDVPLIHHRIVPWVNFRYGIRGMQYWAASVWERQRQRGRSPWDDPCSFADGSTCFHGDGMLVYPGKEIGLTVPAGAYGEGSPAAAYGAAPSLRLKAVRDGIEDYEYLTLAARVNAEAAGRAVTEVACGGDAGPGSAAANCFDRWDQRPETLAAARERLAAVIEAGLVKTGREEENTGGKAAGTKRMKRRNKHATIPG